MILDSYLYSNTGGRPYNQDSVGKREENTSACYVLADGLGGHQYGELASECVVKTVLAAREPKAGEQPEEWLVQQLKEANQNILQLQKEKNAQMKSTAVVLLIEEQKVSWAHVGDSRLYYIHRGKIAAITEDHSVAYRKYRRGEITREQIGTDEDQSRLLRVMGAAERNEPDCETARDGLEEGDGFLLCSDGSWEYLQNEEILIDFLKAESAQEWTELLLLRIIERVPKGHDNLSIIAVCAGKGEVSK